WPRAAKGSTCEPQTARAVAARGSPRIAGVRRIRLALARPADRRAVAVRDAHQRARDAAHRAPVALEADGAVLAAQPAVAAHGGLAGRDAARDLALVDALQLGLVVGRLALGPGGAGAGLAGESLAGALVGARLARRGEHEEGRVAQEVQPPAVGDDGVEGAAPCGPHGLAGHRADGRR